MNTVTEASPREQALDREHECEIHGANDESSFAGAAEHGGESVERHVEQHESECRFQRFPSVSATGWQSSSECSDYQPSHGDEPGYVR